MGTISNLDDHRPHAVITTFAGDVHVIPVSFFKDLAEGRMTIDDLDHRDAIVQIIVAEWLDYIGA